MHSQQARLGGFYALAAFLSWGFIPLYFKAIDQVGAVETLAHRAIWACVCLALWLHYKHQWPSVISALQTKAIIIRLFLSTVFIAINWGVFIWAVNSERVLETSLGYFINPLVNIFLGWLFLKERLRKLQWMAVILAAAGTLNLLIQYGELPWVALTLAFSFGSYGLLRKTTQTESLPGLFIETLLLAPAAILYLCYLEFHHKAHFLHINWQLDTLLITAGIITLLPLLWFGNAARRLHLSTLGFFQYIAPSISFCLAVFLFDEHFSIYHLITFSCIWLGLGMFSFDAFRYNRNR